jgi:hypothetical protein
MPRRTKQPSDLTNEMLLDLYISARSLAKLHKKRGGLQSHRTYSETKAEEYRTEIIKRMSAYKAEQPVILASKTDVINFRGSSEDLRDGTDSYYALLAWEHHGLSIRDNTFDNWVSIGKQIEGES